MAIKFITGNKRKVAEAQEVLAPFEVEQVEIDLDEIQGVDPHIIIQHKLQEALKHHQGQFFIEDSSLYLECFDYKLPGPLIKWFNDTIGTNRIAIMTERMGKVKARATTVVGLTAGNGRIEFFEGTVEGQIISPRGTYLFGYDPIFLPDGSELTLSELKAAGNFSISPRGLAMGKFKEYLQANFS